MSEDGFWDTISTWKGKNLHDLIYNILTKKSKELRDEKEGE